MAQKKVSFKKGTIGRKARGVIAEQLKEEGDSPNKAFAIATTIAKGTKTSAATKRLAKHGIKIKKGSSK